MKDKLITNALCVDVDDLDLSFFEAGFSKKEGTYLVEKETENVLDGLSELGIKATFFIPGAIATRSKALVKLIFSNGHDIASHGYKHCLVYNMSRSDFLQDIRASKDLLQSIIGVEVDTYKAPVWSLIPGVEWAYEELIAAGFKIDHSAMPKYKESLGWSQNELRPQVYKGSLTVIPPTTKKIAGAVMPYCGGFYGAHVPVVLQKKYYRSLNQSGLPFNYYFHPFEFSTQKTRRERFFSSELRKNLYSLHAGKFKKIIKKLAADFTFSTLKNAYREYL